MSNTQPQKPMKSSVPFLLPAICRGAIVILALVGANCQGQGLEPVDVFQYLPAIPVEDRNPWPEAWEQALRDRFRAWVDREEFPAPSADWSGEKSANGAFMALFKGRRELALAAMRTQDAAGHTAGIDFYWCFHLDKQPRIYFQFGKLQPPHFLPKMKKGAQLWTAEDPRPNLELILQMDHPDAKIAGHARKQLAAMWRNREQVTEMIATARGECVNGQPANKLAFAAYLEKILPQWPQAMPADTAAWRSWWKLLAAGDWKIYEEYERRTNPRPHPKYGIGTGPVGAAWDPSVRGGWVDWRNTDNLRSMREVSVYLFAEETGNELVRKIYLERIRRSARSFFGIGNGEWSSPAYLGLTIAGYQMLYDFARDREARLLGKGLLDYLVTTTAVKYFRGGACGPNTRDYGTWASGSGGHDSVIMSSWLPAPSWPIGQHWSEHAFLTAYRPPPAVIALANGEIPLPSEHLASHPVYSNWLPDSDAAPAFHEVQYRSREFQMGSQIEGGTYDGNGGKILLAHPERGCDYVIPSRNIKGNLCVGGNDRIAQCRNAMLWLGATSKDKDGAFRPTEWGVLIPKDAQQEREGAMVFLRSAAAWLAIHPVHSAIGEGKATSIRATGEAAPVTGLAIEVADALHFPDYEAFKAAARGKAKVSLQDAKVSFIAASGAQVAMTWDGGNGLPQVERDGKPHDWNQHRALFQAGSTGPSPVTLGWKEGRLVMEAGGYRFEGTMDMTAGTYSFTNTTVKKP